MAWATPRTWVAGEVPTPAQFNTHIRDNFQVTGPHLVETAGDFVLGDGANVLRRLPIGSVGNVLTVNPSEVWAWVNQTVPAGAIVFFNGTACPTGYTIVSGARGRMIVGLPASGTVAGTVGSALTNLATRTITTVVAHTHAVGTLAAPSGGAHTHTLYSGAQEAPFVAITQSGHPSPPSDSVGADGVHTHTLSGSTASSGSASVDVTMPYVQYLICSKD